MHTFFKHGLRLILGMSVVLFSLPVMAQDPAPVGQPAPEVQPVPAPEVQPAPDAVVPVANPAAQDPAAQPDPSAPAAQPQAEDEVPPIPANSNDPGDIVANYFNAMGDIIAQNMDNPQALVEKFTSFVKENEKPMKAASKAFDSKMASLKGNEAEVYRETVQRKITPALNKLITLLLDFENRYPDDARKLDTLLKVDAKYTYQQ